MPPRALAGGDPPDLKTMEAEGLALRAEDPAAALGRFEAVLAREPNRARSLKAAGRLLMKARRYEEARPYWERLARLSGDDPEPHVQLARIHRRAGRHELAAAKVERALALAPHHAAAQDLAARMEARRQELFEEPVTPSATPPALDPLRRWAKRIVGTVAPDLGRRLFAGSGEPVRRSVSRRLITRARIQAARGDHAAVVGTLEALLAAAGPTDEAVAAVQEHRESISAQGSRRLTSLVDESSHLVSRLRAAADLRDGAAVVSALEALLSAEGPSERVVELIGQHREAIEAAGAARLTAALDRPRRPGRGGRRRKLSAEAQALAEAVEAARRGGGLNATLDALERLGAAAPVNHFARSVLSQHALGVLEQLDSARGNLSPRTLASTERRLVQIFSGEAWVAQALARRREADGSVGEALALYDGLADAAEGAAPALFHGAGLAARLARWKEALDYAERAIDLAPEDRRIVGGAAELFAEHGRRREAILCWRRADNLGRPSMWVRQGLVRALEATGDDPSLAAEVRRALADASPLSALAPGDQNYLIDMVRRLVQVWSAAPQDAVGRALEAELTGREPTSALREWIRAMIALARPDRTAALRLLDDAMAEQALAPGVALDLHAEKALIEQRYQFFGESLAEFDKASREAVSVGSHYGRRLEIVAAVANLCPQAPAPLRYPECLIDVLLAEAAARPLPYPPEPGHVAMVSGSLGQGGGERQTITVVRKMLNDSRVKQLSLLVRSTHLRPTDDFFLASVEALPVDLAVYGRDWLARSDLEGLVPEFIDRPRLMAALELMPHNAREEIARLCRLLFDRRPRAVHIWQDIPNAAIACVLAGVPNFFIHRGSLAPNYWEQNELQAEAHFRPMRHAYRRLLERPDFVLLNNSISGCRTDQAWLEWPDSTPFQVVYNAVDFSTLGENTGRNAGLLRELGVPEGAPVVGGSFRIVSVKRPLWWIEAARRIREAVPEAHFLIIGDGDMTEEVASFARTHGFAEALHLPGRVTNVGDWYRAMDLMLMTSEREGIPNAIIEAQHFAVPIVATRVGGIHEAIEEGETGFVVDGDHGPGPYADKVIGILGDREWLDRARLRAAEFVHEKFSLEHVVDQLLAYYGLAPAPGEARSSADGA